ncbi:hypothetical protein PG984_013513 [Apiospora sp. TS-2023a]
MAITAMLPLFFKGVAVVLATILLRFLYQGYVHRKAARSLKTQGLVTDKQIQPLLPHSFLLGHWPILAKFSQSHPPDVNIYTFHTWLLKNRETYLPDYEFLPPVVYLDTWPLLEPLAIVTDPVAAAQFTIANSEPRIELYRKYFIPLTSGLDVFMSEGHVWKTWRSRLNPGFSQRNLTALTPEILEEVSVFVDRLKQGAAYGDDGWGPVFQLQEMATDLTTDVIGRAALDMRLHSQSDQSDTTLKSTLVDQFRLLDKFLVVAQGRLTGRWPWHQVAIARNNRTLHNTLLPQIRKKLHCDSEKASLRKYTVLDLALMHVDTDGAAGTSMKEEEPTKEFIERLIANLKMIILAGYDTTASTICFMAKLLQDHPDCLDKLRAEHDAVLGPDPAPAASVLIASPHLLHSLQYTLAVIKETLRLYPLTATIRKSCPGYYLTGADSTV